MTGVVPPFGPVGVVRSVVARELELVSGKRQSKIRGSGRMQNREDRNDGEEAHLHLG
jgi:hypothetical protein